MPTRRIGFLGFEGIQALDLVGPSDAFTSDALRSPEYTVDGEPPYEVVIVGLRAKRFAAASGLEFRAHYVVPSNVRLDTLIIPGGSGLRKTGLADEAAAWISARAPGIRRIASVCTGIYGLAPTGLLDGRAVTTHWSFAADPATGKLVPGDVVAQAEQVRRNLEAVLAPFSLTLDDALMVRVYLTSFEEDYAAFNAAYAAWFKGPLPSRTCVGCSGLAVGAAVEIDLIVGVPSVREEP